MHEKSALIFARWAEPDEFATEGIRFMRDAAALPSSLQSFNIVLGNGTEARASELLERGAAVVLLTDAALLDSAAVARLAQQYGSERIGISLLARKRHVSWTLDTVSNEDFNCVTPSYGKTGWEIVLSDGTATGTDAEWWLGEMLLLGASTALICADIQDDDLNICAGLVEIHGSKLWFSPWQQSDVDLEPWVRYGQIRQLLLPTPNTRDEIEMERICTAAMTEQEIVSAETVKAADGEAATV
jgi:Histidine biosynthesis protein